MSKADGQTQAPKGQVLTDSASEREREILARLEAAEKRAKELQDEVDLYSQGAANGLKLRAEPNGPYKGDHGGYLFRIGPIDPQANPNLKTITINACDESELKRWYCATNEHPPGSGKRLDPLKAKLAIECLDPKRARLLLHRKRLAGVRAKLEVGGALSPSDLELLDKYEYDIIGTPKEQLTEK